jgi:RNA polymerase sigma-70 factor, ECF subfamily
MQDAEAIRRCRQGDLEAFGHMVRRYQQRALGHARALTGNDADAADAAQNAFLDAFAHLGGFDETREFYPWFYVLLRHCCYKQRARSRAQAGLSALAESTAETGSVEERYDLRRALDRLSVEDRELIVLKHMNGWTYDELALRLEIPRGTVMSRLFHARHRLKDLMSASERTRR